MPSNVSPKVEALLSRAEMGRNNENNPALTSSQITDRKYKAGAEMRTAVRKLTKRPYFSLNNMEKFVAMEQVFKDYATPKIKEIGDSNLSKEDKMLSVRALEQDMQAKYPAGFKMVNYVHEQRDKAMQMTPQIMADMAGMDPNSGYEQGMEGGMFPQTDPTKDMVAPPEGNIGGPVPGSLREGLGNGLQ